jgi:ABC-2 type transport system permease protein
MNANAFQWSVRRELWENRSIYVAPLIVAAVALFGFLIHSFGFAKKMQAIAALQAAKQVSAIVLPYSLAASMILFFTWIVGVFYCLDALHGERRDRSILFWKSMPVSDATTVLAKASIPLVVLPAIGIAAALATQVMMLLSSTSVLLFRGMSPALLWESLPLATMTVVMIYGVTIHALWFAPVYAWLLLVSAWAKRAVLLWAVVPAFALFAIETLAFGTGWVAGALKYRFMGAMTEGFKPNALKHPITQLSQLDPARFLSSPNLWIGLVLAAAFIVLAVRLRRYREPI